MKSIIKSNSGVKDFDQTAWELNPSLPVLGQFAEAIKPQSIVTSSLLTHPFFVEFLLVMGKGQIFWPKWDWVNFLLIRSGHVSHLWFRLGKFPLKIPNFSIFSLQAKKLLCLGSKTGWPLIYCGSKVCLGYVGSGSTSSFFCFLLAKSIFSKLDILLSSQTPIIKNTKLLSN